MKAVLQCTGLNVGGDDVSILAETVTVSTVRHDEPGGVIFNCRLLHALTEPKRFDHHLLIFVLKQVLQSQARAMQGRQFVCENLAANTNDLPLLRAVH